VVPNLPIINPARPVTEEALKALEEDFRQAAREAVVPFAGAGAEAGQDLLDARVVRLFSQEKVLWVEVRLGRWWHSLDAKSQDEVLARLGRLLYSLDEKAFNQKRDVILTAKDTKGRRLGDVTVTPFSTNVRLASPPAKKNKPSS
jgi:hypothetical protein